MKEVPLTKGYTALVDDEDFERVSDFKWCASEHAGLVYAVRFIKVGKRKKTMKLHRFILGFPLEWIDHVNGNGLDNTRANLRLCSRSENAHNTVRRRPGSRPLGVKKTRSGRWAAQTRVHGKYFWLGTFDSPEEAQNAYSTFVLKHMGDFAVRKLKESA